MGKANYYLKNTNFIHTQFQIEWEKKGQSEAMHDLMEAIVFIAMETAPHNPESKPDAPFNSMRNQLMYMMNSAADKFNGLMQSRATDQNAMNEYARVFEQEYYRVRGHVEEQEILDLEELPQIH